MNVIISLYAAYIYLTIEKEDIRCKSLIVNVYIILALLYGLYEIISRNKVYIDIYYIFSFIYLTSFIIMFRLKFLK
jgi:hypothetical protein